MITKIVDSVVLMTHIETNMNMQNTDVGPSLTLTTLFQFIHHIMSTCRSDASKIEETGQREWLEPRKRPSAHGTWVYS